MLILTHLKPKGKQISGRLQSPDLAGLIYHFSSNAIYFPKKSVKKLERHKTSRLKNSKNCSAGFGPASHKVHKPCWHNSLQLELL